MSKIQVLDQITIDKIAAGEIIERPASVIKELVENAIDAGATAITTEIKDGGISSIRITDNGCGISQEEVPLAFLRHSTSKIRTVEDLTTVASLGFRGEALSSIAAVSQVELITREKSAVLGTCYQIDGGVEKTLEETGAKEGTTFLVRNLFYNTPARRKFLKTAMTEASHVNELMMRMALSHPEISFQFINNGQTKLHTSGNGKLKDAIYQIFGREIAANLVPVEAVAVGVKVTGYLGKPVISRGNRNYEIYYINGRYVKSNIIAKAIEDGYKDFTMQHKYPFTVLHFEIDGERIDVNVHPTKMELRFSNQQQVYDFVYQAIKDAFHKKEFIPKVELPESKPELMKVEKPIVTPVVKVEKPSVAPPAKPVSKMSDPPVKTEKNLDYFMQKMKERVTSYHNQNSRAEVAGKSSIFKEKEQVNRIREAVNYGKKPEQLSLFEEKLLTPEAVKQHRIIGQLFDTYWLIEFQEQLYIIDQHAAHERVLYEKTLAGMKTREFTSQYISPPIVLNLTMQEEQLLNEHMEVFSRIGFEIESFEKCI